MIGLDTNIVVRYVMQDDARQAPRASRLVESMTAQEPGFVSVGTVVELVWVLELSYELSREQVGTVLEGLLASRELLVDGRKSSVRRFARTGPARLSLPMRSSCGSGMRPAASER